METENKKEEFDFEVNEVETVNKKKNNAGKKASAAALAAGAAVAGGATALGAEAAMSLADEAIIDPEQVSDAIADSTVELVRPKVTPKPRVVEEEIEPSQEQLDNFNEAAGQVASDNATEVAEPEEIAEGDVMGEINEIVEPLVDVEDVSGEDIAMILEENIDSPLEVEEVMPIVDDIDGMAYDGGLEEDADEFTTIDDIDIV